MSVVPFDSLAMAGKPEAGGFSHDQARVIASALADALGERMATADGVQLLHHDMDPFCTEMRQEFESFKGEMQREFGSFKVEVRQELEAFKAEMRQELDARFRGLDGRFAGIDGRFAGIDGRFRDVDARFRETEQRLTIRLGSMIVIATGILLAANFFA